MIAVGTQHLRDVDVLLAAIDAGARVIDTADVYGTEPLVAEARARRPEVALTIATKGGLVRDADGWRPDGRARHLEAAAEASAARLGAAPDLYLLHAIDPQVPLATSARALARIAERGLARAVGLSNVGRRALDEAAAIVPIAAVEVELSPWRIDAVRGGVVAWCAERGVPLLAHRPLGGAAGVRRLAHDHLVRAIAARLDATPAEVALAWLRALGVVPLPGPTRVETARSAARALTLDDDARRALDARFLGLVAGLGRRAPRRDGEVVVVMGMPAAGKSTAIADLCAQGGLRLNRDERGGTLDTLARALDAALADGATRIVLDNTYPTRASRAPVIAAAHRHGLAVRCVWLDTPIEDAQVNAATRMLERHGRLLDPDEIKRAARRDPATFYPTVQFAWRRALEPPALDEGFDAVEIARFARRPRGGSRRALIVELPVLATPGAAERVARRRADGWLVLATAWRPGELPPDIETAVCPHEPGPPRCWCRKPMPGLGLVLARAHDLDLAASLHVGRGAADRGFAARLGLPYVDADDAW